MFLLDRLLIGGIRFALDKVAQVVDSELNDSERLREELLSAQMSFELGEIDAEGFARIEGAVLGRLRELRQQEMEAAQGLRPVGVEVELDEGCFYEPDATRGDG